MCNLDLLLCSRGHADDCSFLCLELNIVKFIQEFLLLISCPNGNVTGTQQRPMFAETINI